MINLQPFRPIGGAMFSPGSLCELRAHKLKGLSWVGETLNYPQLPLGELATLVLNSSKLPASGETGLS